MSICQRIAPLGGVMARVKAVLRRSRATQRTPTVLAPLQVDEQGWRAPWQGRALGAGSQRIRSV